MKTENIINQFNSIIINRFSNGNFKLSNFFIINLNSDQLISVINKKTIIELNNQTFSEMRNVFDKILSIIYKKMT